MSEFRKRAFAQSLRGFMQYQRQEAMSKYAAPDMSGMPMDPAMMGGIPVDYSMQGGMPQMDMSMPPQDPQQGQQAPQQQNPQETLNIQAKGPDAIDAIKSMMGSAGLQPTPEELPPELLMQPKMASADARYCIQQLIRQSMRR